MTADIGAALDKSFPNTAAGYEALATKIINDKITKYDLDGIDFDVERSSIPKIYNEPQVFLQPFRNLWGQNLVQASC
ncbi:hypothetical protein KUH03_41670 [Sphingobacterium sp. E70]|uniref:EndoS/ChiA family endoglycosidase n=1 Tax=Sphingobacterium sp. E70 TaxID=2853439 RepID=UPI00211D03EA|nr:hypothetical protein [Sphingobacterium sp. E70]ULT25260.1 hypothetical protein KUH03_41670 [Sphingobacterium sp. E70]